MGELRLKFTDHCFKRMVERGISPRMIYSIVRRGDKSIQKDGNECYSIGNTMVIVDKYRVITCMVSKHFTVENGVKRYIFKKARF
jgi:hypothetical protein